MLRNLEQTNSQIVSPVLENSFFHQMLALEVKKIYTFFGIVQCDQRISMATICTSIEAMFTVLDGWPCSIKFFSPPSFPPRLLSSCRNQQALKWMSQDKCTKLIARCTEKFLLAHLRRDNACLQKIYIRHSLRLNAGVADTESQKVYDNFANIGGQT